MSFFKSSQNSKTENPLTSGGISLKEQDQTCIVSEGTRIDGKFNTAENARIDGTIIGDVACEKKIVMGESGRIQGKVEALTATIKGKIDGDMFIKDSLHLHGSARVNGAINAKILTVEEGAVYNGACKIGDRAAKA